MQENNPIVRFEYSISNDEENIAFKQFQKKYVFKKNLIKSVLFLILLGLFIDQVVRKPDYTMGWVLITICAAFLFLIWYNPYKIRKNLMKALKEIENDVYEFELYPEYFSIKTLYFSDNDEVTSLSQLEENEEDQITPSEVAPREVYFDKEDVAIDEIEEMFVIYIKKQTLYSLPKRIISSIQQEEMRKIFTDKVGDDFIIKCK